VEAIANAKFALLDGLGHRRFFCFHSPSQPACDPPGSSIAFFLANPLLVLNRVTTRQFPVPVHLRDWPFPFHRRLCAQQCLELDPPLMGGVGLT